MKAIYRNVRISPKKANLIASLVRGDIAMHALDLLKYTPKKGARILRHIIKSAVANAENNFKQKNKELIISKIMVTKGPAYKRYMPISRGRTHPILKRTSHVLVEVNLQENIQFENKNNDSGRQKIKDHKILKEENDVKN